MKALLEKRSKLISQLEEMLGDGTEVRTLDEEQAKKFEDMKKEVENIDARLEQHKEVRNLKENKTMKVEETNMNTEFRSQLMAGQEVEVRVNETKKANMKGEMVQNGALITQRPVELGLKDLVRKEYFNGHQVISVQRNKLGKLVPVAELAEIANKQMLVETVDLKPNKMATMVVVSEEVVNDNSYDVEAMIREEGRQAIEETIESVVGNALNTMAGIQEVALAVPATLSVEDLAEMYYKLKHEYRKNGTWIVNSAQLKAISLLVDSIGRPILHQLNGTPNFTIFGRPVTVCEDVNRIFFSDLSKAVVVGIGKDASVKRSDEAFFTTAGIAFKTSIYLDCKTLLTESTVKLADLA